MKICVRKICSRRSHFCIHQHVHGSSKQGCVYDWCVGDCKDVDKLTESDRTVLALRAL